jgi:hypothetical protein
MTGVGIEPTTPVFKQAKTVHALQRAATVIGFIPVHFENILNNFQTNYYTRSFFHVIS